MPSKREALYEESRYVFAGEGFEDDEAFLTRGKSEHARAGAAGGPKKGANWFELPRFDDILGSSKAKQSRSSRSDSEHKEEQVKHDIRDSADTVSRCIQIQPSKCFAPTCSQHAVCWNSVVLTLLSHIVRIGLLLF